MILKGANYRLPMYRVTPKPFSMEEITADLKLLKDLGGDLVEVYIPFHKADFNEVKVFLSICDDLSLKPILTMFDWSTPFKEIQESVTWLNKWLEHFADDKNLWAWGLINEINLNPNPPSAEFDDDTKELWVRKMVETLRKRDRIHKVTLEFQIEFRFNLDLLSRVHDLFDFISLSYYGPPQELPLAIQRVRLIVGLSRGLLLSEFGYPSEHNEIEQYIYYLNMAAQIKQNQKSLFGISFWFLIDLKNEMQFGLFREDRTPKPSAKIIEGLYK